jgi:Flp pilus assembly protein TadD
MSKKFGQTIAFSLKGGGSYRMLANRVVEGERRVKFRLLGSDGAFNYHDYVVVVRGGSPKAVDIHMLTTGEPISTTLRRTLLPIAAESKKGLVERLTSKESSYVKSLPVIAKLGEFQTNPQAALAAYASLPDALKTDKNVLMLRVQAASMVDEPSYLAAMEDYRKAFPADASMRVMSIDYFYMKKMYKETLEQVTELERATGPDAHLNTLRAGVQAQLGNVQPGRDELKTALELEPDLAEAVNLAIALDLAAKDEAGAFAKIADARKRKVNLGTVSQNPDYVAFMAKPDTQKKLAASEAATSDKKTP